MPLKILERIEAKINREYQSAIHKVDIYSGDKFIENTDIHSFINSRKPFPKIALVKQEVYPDLYCCPPGTKGADVVFSTVLRSGFVALFTEMDADFWIVKKEPDKECKIYYDQVACCSRRGSFEDLLRQFEEMVTKVPAEGKMGHVQPQGAYAVSCESIDWGKYDIVISMNIAVPFRVVEQYPQVVWCYCLGEPCMDAYAQSMQKPLGNYNLFLNQKFRKFKLNPKPRFHEIDFPYYIQYYGCFSKLLQLPLEPYAREGIFIEKHSYQVFTEEEVEQVKVFGTLSQQTGTAREMYDQLLQRKYFIRLGGKVTNRWGNSMIEAIAAGCLFLGNPKEFWNNSLFTPNTCIYSFSELISRIRYFESNPEAYEEERKKQQQLVNYLCFVRPITELLDKASVLKLNNKTV